MTSRENFFNLLEGRPTDRTLTGFWIHFPQETHHGDEAIDVHMDFMRETGTDLLKVMNENVFYGSDKVYSSRDLANIRSFTRRDRLFSEEMDIIKRVCQRAGGEYPTLATIHGLVASTFHATGFAGYFASMGYSLAIFARENPQAMKEALKRVTDSLLELIDGSLEAGVDGIFYAALGGEKHYFTDEEFAEFIAPLETQIYRHIQSRTKADILHICKSNVEFSRFTHLNPSVVNWCTYQNDLSLVQGEERFPGSIIMGGFQDRSGLLIDGTDRQIAAHAWELLEQMKGKRYILGTDCTLPYGIPYHKISCAVEAVKAAGQ